MKRHTAPVLVREDTADTEDPHVFTEPGTGLYLEKTRANLKIQEGCDFFCSYCIVPHARGNPRSRDWDDVLREAGELIDRGHRELVLTGVNTSLYRSGARELPQLVEAVANLPGDFRVRLSSVEPGPVIPPLVQVIRRNPNVCRFLHLPLQYGENEILARMRRRYTSQEFAELAQSAVENVPGLCLGSDVIVGFPGETAAHFEECRRFVERMPFAYLHVFTFSPRRGTPAATMPHQVNGAVAAQRHRELSRLALAKADHFAAAQIGSTLQVLPEAVSGRGCLEGWSDNYLRVEIAGAHHGPVPDGFIDARIDRATTARHVVGSAIRR